MSSAGHALVKAAEHAGLPWLEIVIALSVSLSSGAVLRAAGRIWLGWGASQSPRPDTGTADDPGGEPEDRSDTANSANAEGAPGTQGSIGSTEGGSAGTDRDQDGREWSGRLRRVPLTMVLPPLALLAIRLGLGLTSGIEEHAAAAAAAFSDRAAYATAVLHPHGGPIPIGGTVVVPASPRRPRAALAVGTGWLCRLHSGLVGDQVTWLVADLALLAGLSQAALH